MNNYRTTARVVGSIYPAGFVFGIGGNSPIQSVLGEPDRLAALSATSNMVAMGALLWLLAVIGKAVHGSLSAIMGSSLGNVACNPRGLWEVFFGLWLIVKGFDSMAIAPQARGRTQ